MLSEYNQLLRSSPLYARYFSITSLSQSQGYEMLMQPSLFTRYKLVREALRERKYFLDTAPHLSMWLPIMIPIQKWWQAPYYWAGTKFYDLLAGSEGIESSYFLTKTRAMDVFPMLRRDNLWGALVYYGKRAWTYAAMVRVRALIGTRWSPQRLENERISGDDGCFVWGHGCQSCRSDWTGEGRRWQAHRRSH